MFRNLMRPCTRRREADFELRNSDPVVNSPPRSLISAESAEKNRAATHYYKDISHLHEN